MNCIFEKLDDEYVKCKVCGLVVHAKNPEKVYSLCPGKPPKYPPVVKQAANYAQAVVHHVATGCETCTDEKTEVRLAICKTCEKYNLKEERCTVCGCKANSSKNAFLNKLRMKSQSCPEGKWD